LAEAIGFLAQDEKIRKTWGDVVVTDRGPLIAFVVRQWTYALGAFPILSAPTAIELHGARVIALDIEEIATRGGQFSAWESGIAYMLARQLAVAHFYLHEDQLNDWPPLYRDYQRTRILELRAHHKRASFDEVHRLRGGASATLEQIETDALESRKHGVELAFCSQLFDHFPETLLRIATVRVVLGASEREADDIAQYFGLSPADRQAMRRHLHGPTPAGAPMLLSVDTSDGRFTQMVYLTVGVEELWALTTVEQDRALRKEVIGRLAPALARRALARRFPQGSCVAELRARTEALELARGALIQERDRELLIQQLAEEVIDLAGAGEAAGV
jgi:intracellular multiplication protein IcmB